MKTPLRFRLQTWHAYFRLFTNSCADNRFIVFAQGRTGSWLLRDLLNCHQSIQADKEVLQYPVVSPNRVLQGLSSKSAGDVYGCHIQIKQIRDTQGLSVEPFLTNLHQTGWKIIYLRRENYLRQSVSSMLAVQRRVWKSRQDVSLGQTENTLHSIDCDALLEWLHERDRNQKQEALALQKLPYLELVYERDLRCAEQHQTTAEKIFEYLGLEPVMVSSSLKRLGTDNLAEQIQNYDEMVAMLKSNGYAHFLHDV